MELRARSQLAKKAGVAVTAVTQMTIWASFFYAIS